MKNDTEKGTRGQGLGVGSGSDSRYSIDLRAMCALYRPQKARRVLPPSRPLPPSLSPPDPIPSVRPTGGAGVGREVCRVPRAQVSLL